MEYTLEYLSALIRDKIEENGSLEYKAAEALWRSDGKKKEITKDVSAFANGSGGTIIYGIREHADSTHKHLPEKIDPVNQLEFSKEWLDQIIGLIQPRIEGLQVIPVHVGPKISDFCYVVEIPQSGTAHQALDLRYYKRRNFESSPMEDYEIRDVSNRRKHALLDVKVRIISRGHVDGSHIAVKVSNLSKIIAKHYLVRVQMPTLLLGKLIWPEDNPRIDSENGMFSWIFGLGNSLGFPLFPESSIMLHRNFKYVAFLHPDPRPSIDEIRLTCYADEMEKIEIVKPVAAAMADWI